MNQMLRYRSEMFKCWAHELYIPDVNSKIKGIVAFDPSLEPLDDGEVSQGVNLCRGAE